MVRPTSKTELISAATQQYAKLQSLISQLTEEELKTPFDFQKMKKRKRCIGRGIKTSEMFSFIFMSGNNCFWIGCIPIKMVSKNRFCQQLIIGETMVR